MMRMELACTANQRGPIVEVVGTLDSSTAASVDKVLARFRATGVTVRVDLKRCEYVSSAGWGLLVSARAAATAGKGDLVVCGAHPQVFAVARHLGADSLLRFE